MIITSSLGFFTVLGNLAYCAAEAWGCRKDNRFLDLPAYQPSRFIFLLKSFPLNFVVNTVLF